MEKNAEPNTNCLQDIECPKCGHTSPMEIVVRSWARVYDDGVEETYDTEWDENSRIHCLNCGHRGNVFAFVTEGEEDDLPCERVKEYNGTWSCVNDHTGCMWNDGHNQCGYKGESLSPLGDD